MESAMEYKIDEMVRGYGHINRMGRRLTEGEREELLGGDPRYHQEGGDHYKSFAIQPIDFVLKNKLQFCEANVIKYVCRHRVKGGAEDLRKARHYIDLLINEEYGDA